MRCTNCGTENAPDSRFCGGCGAPMTTSRVVPTVKIADDAPIAPPSVPPGTYVVPNRAASAPYASMAPGTPAAPGPASLPPAARAAGRPPSSTPPAGASIAPQPAPVSPPPGPAPAPRAAPARAPMPAASVAGASVAPPSGVRWLVPLLVIIDLGLAVGGALLLRAGLAPRAPATSPAPAPAAAPPASAPAAAPPASAPPPAAHPHAPKRS